MRPQQRVRKQRGVGVSGGGIGEDGVCGCGGGGFGIVSRGRDG